MEQSLVIGIDVGGTNTDSVLLDTAPDAPGPPAARVRAWDKTPTTADVTSSVERTVDALFSRASSTGSSGSGSGNSGGDNGLAAPTVTADAAAAAASETAASVAAVTVGTTHFLNAVLSRDGGRLARVAVVRLASFGFGADTPPLAGWPAELARLVRGHVTMVGGGVNVDGSVIEAVDEEGVRRAAREIAARGLREVVVCGIGAPMDAGVCAGGQTQEERAREILTETLGAEYAAATTVVCSRDVAGAGLLERESAAVVNAAIGPYARRTVRALTLALARRRIGGVGGCPLYMTSNTGHLLSAAEAAAFPVRIFSSGPTNSIRGAAYLAGITTRTTGGPRAGAIVVDIGGTTTDAGFLLPNGYPRLASSYTTIAGVRVNLEMLQVDSVALGGGSVVRRRQGNGTRGAEGEAEMTVGPDSVGCEITSKALCFGGDVVTATDVAVAASVSASNADRPAIGTRAPAPDRLDGETVAGARATIRRTLERLVDRLKTAPDPCPAILVGGGALLVGPGQGQGWGEEGQRPSGATKSLYGISSITVPTHAAVANAVGAAIAQVGGCAIRMVTLTPAAAAAAAAAAEIDAARQDVLATALADVGARGGDVSRAVVTRDEVAGMPYVAGQKRVSVEVAAPAEHGRFLAAWRAEEAAAAGLAAAVVEASTEAEERAEEDAKAGADAKAEAETDSPRLSRTTPTAAPSSARGLAAYRPHVAHGRWHVSATDVHFLAIGCYILGCGGGGSPYAMELALETQLTAGKTVEIVDVCSLSSSSSSAAAAADGAGGPEGWGALAGGLADDSLLAPVCGVGSPAVAAERPGGHGVLDSMRTMEAEIGRGFDGVLAVEVGGSNGLQPLLVGSTAHYGLPVVDGDLMGRAYPNFEKITPYVATPDINALLPVTLSSGTGTNVTVPSARGQRFEPDDAAGAEGAIRDVVVTMGSAAGATGRPVAVAGMRTVGIANSHSLAWRLGRAVAVAREEGRLGGVAGEVVRVFGGERGERGGGSGTTTTPAPAPAAKVLFYGKIIAVEHGLSASAHMVGSAVLRRLDADEVGAGAETVDVAIAPDPDRNSPDTIIVDFVNENLAVRTPVATAAGRHASPTAAQATAELPKTTAPAPPATTYLAAVPTLIILLDMTTGEAVGTPEYRYGLKVAVVAAAPHPRWTSARGQAVGGAAGFGGAVDVEAAASVAADGLAYAAPRSVIEEFGRGR